MSSPRTLAEMLGEQASLAIRRGTEALSRGESAWARSWFERARRLSPDDPTVALALANLSLVQRDPASIDLFREAAAATDMREAWLGLVAALWQSGDVDGAAAELSAFLAGHVLPVAMEGLADMASALATATGRPGWCGVIGQGEPRRLRLVVHCDSPVEIRRDGRSQRGAWLGAGQRIEAVAGGAPLLGSPIDLARLRRVEGIVTGAGLGVTGWAWCPADPDAAVELRLLRGSTSVRVIADDDSIMAPRPLTRPRGFTVPAARLPPGRGRLRVVGADGRDLAGSPLDPGAEARVAAAIAQAVARGVPARGPSRRHPMATAAAAAELAGPPAASPSQPDRPVAVVVPVYRGLDITRACLDSVLDTIDGPTRLIVVDDATPEPELAALLDGYAASGRLTLLRHARNQGFPASANAGLRAALALMPAHDVLLLNSDTRVPTGRGRSWLHRLRAAVHAAPDIGSATPLSNDATIASYPERDRVNPPPDAQALRRLDALAARANPGVTVTIPTAIGFCMYLRHECLIDTGLLRAELFAQGYGEENDLCIRARHLGWRHVAVPGVMVAHVGGASFGTARAPLLERNLAMLERLHPGYHALIAAYCGRHPVQDALAPARRRLDALRWAAGRREAAAILVTHHNGGGVERVVRDRCAAITAAGQRAVVLRPVPDPDSTEAASLPGLCQVSDGASASHPNLIFDLPSELGALARLLRPDRPALIEIHHRLGHHDAVMDLADRLGVPFTLSLHDYAGWCPLINLVGPDHRYCGEPEDPATCDACVVDAGRRRDGAPGVAALRARSSAEFDRASRVIVPSPDMASRLKRHFPRLHAQVEPLEDDTAVPAPGPVPDILPRRVCVVGAIGFNKGYDVLLACARDAARRNLPLEFFLAGHSTDDARLEGTGRVFITGRYREADGETVVRGTASHLAFLPSIWPETWGFTLGLAWRCGLRAMVFDIGAMAARVRATGHGWALPLGLSAAAINMALIAPPGSGQGATDLRDPARTAYAR